MWIFRRGKKKKVEPEIVEEPIALPPSGEPLIKPLPPIQPDEKVRIYHDKLVQREKPQKKTLTKVKMRQEEDTDNISFDDYLIFQETEATSHDLESLVQLERALVKGRRALGEGSGALKWTMVIFVGVIIVIIALSVLPDLLKGM